MDLKNNRPLFIDILHIFVFCGFAVAQPMYDLLSQYGNFFVARGSKSIDIFLLVIALSIIIPSAFGLIEIILELISTKLRQSFHIVISFLLVSCLLLQVLKKVAAFNIGYLVLAFSIILGVIFSIFYARSKGLKSFITILSPSIVIFPIIFLFFSPINRLAFPDDVKITSAKQAKSDVPVIFIMADAIPIHALMDENDEIDPIRYPNIRALADDGYFFKNHTVNAHFTMQSIPATLSGMRPVGRSLATLEDHPNNIFTLLSNSHDIYAVEATSLCPEEVNTFDRDEDSSYRLQSASAIADLSTVYLHIVLPENISKKLPDITKNWGDFVQTSLVDEEKRKNESKAKGFQRGNDKNFYLIKKYRRRLNLYDDLFNALSDDKERPTFSYIHTIFPHPPFEHLPSGRRYNRYIVPTGTEKGETDRWIWNNNDWLIRQGYQRYLLQLMALDTVIGELMAKLKAKGMYDKSLIILTADHGQFYNVKTDIVRVGNMIESEIAAVPLFMKIPYQKEGVVSEENVEAIDVLPTIADLVGVEVPWKVDGRSIFDESTPPRPDKRFLFNKSRPEDDRMLVYKAKNDIRYKSSLEVKLEIFGSGRTKPNGLFTFGPHGDELVDKEISGFGSIEKSDFIVKISEDVSFSGVELSNESFTYTINRDPLPACVSGTIVNDTNTPLDEVFELAVAVNGTIRTTTYSYKTADNNATNFYAILPEKSFKANDNSIKIYIIDKDKNGGVKLLSLEDDADYILQDDLVTISHGDKEIPIVQLALRGFVEEIKVKDGNITLLGWAADVKNGRIPDSLVLFLDGKTIVAHTSKEYEWVARRFNKKGLLRSGYEITFPASMVKDRSRVTFVAISGDLASPIYSNYVTKGLNFSFSRKVKSVNKASKQQRTSKEIHEKALKQNKGGKKN